MPLAASPMVSIIIVHYKSLPIVIWEYLYYIIIMHDMYVCFIVFIVSCNIDSQVLCAHIHYNCMLPHRFTLVPLRL